MAVIQRYILADVFHSVAQLPRCERVLFGAGNRVRTDDLLITIRCSIESIRLESTPRLSRNSAKTRLGRESFLFAAGLWLGGKCLIPGTYRSRFAAIDCCVTSEFKFRPLFGTEPKFS